MQLPPNDPESKGVVERRNGFFETSFMPGRTFASPADFNAQFGDWLSRANARVVRTIKARPVDLIDADRAAMLPLPPVPLQLGWRERIRLGRDYYVRLDTNDYSVDPTAIGRMVDVTADLERVRVRLDGRIVADHARVWARGTHRHRPRPRRRPPAAARAVPAAPDAVADWRRAGPGPGRLRPRVRARSTGRGGRVMADQATAPTGEAVKQIHYLAAALKAPRITEAAARLADQARDAGWTHEDYLAAVLEREVSARNASGAAAAHPRRRVPGPQDPRGLRLRRPTRHPPTGRRARLRRRS